MKAGYVAIIGRPNAGKSTLMNRLIGQKLSIVSDKPQTTRHRVTGVLNHPDGQLVFIDTPGIHKPEHTMNRRMVKAALDSLREADLVVLVVDALEEAGWGDRFVMDLLTDLTPPLIVVLNKVDRMKSKAELLPRIESYAKGLSCHAVIPISALNGDQVDALLTEMLAALPEGEPLFDEDYFTDQSERTLASELIREKVLKHTRDELPYTTAVVIDQFAEPEAPGKITKIYASILVDHDSQKPIVIGKGGEMIKRIGTEARIDLQEMLEGPVFLDLHVKVRKDWREDERLLDELGLPKRR
jgi:GTP-binding protein Era